MVRWDDAIRVADTARHPQTDKLKRTHYQWLLQTAQEDKAAAVKEKEGDYLTAINLYLKGGLAARAAQVCPTSLITPDLVFLGQGQTADDIAESFNLPVIVSSYPTPQKQPSFF